MSLPDVRGCFNQTCTHQKESLFLLRFAGITEAKVVFGVWIALHCLEDVGGQQVA